MWEPATSAATTLTDKEWRPRTRARARPTAAASKKAGRRQAWPLVCRLLAVTKDLQQPQATCGHRAAHKPPPLRLQPVDPLQQAVKGGLQVGAEHAVDLRGEAPDQVSLACKQAGAEVAQEQPARLLQVGCR